jgi:selenocysteine-specific elongation factor
MIIGTAGHIDHGKTTLVRALTGVDTDRLPEEKRRGISIELGYAFLDGPDGERLGFIDVPGHERLVHTMVSGATGIDVALLLVAADDGVMPQTREHLAVLSLLGISRGLAVVTKTDRVDPDRVQAVMTEVAVLLEQSSLAGAAILAVSAHTGEGIEALRTALWQLAAQVGPHPRKNDAFRLAVDRVFSLSGAGTVVTGTVHAGHVNVGDELVCVPSLKRVRVRSVHAQNREVAQANAGDRCALALAGLSRDEVERGHWVVSSSARLRTERFDAWLELGTDEPRPLRSGTRVHLHLGSCEVMATVALLEPSVIQPGAAGLVQLVLREPMGAWHGDRFVLRDESASRTLAGGVVLDPVAPARYRRTPQRLAFLQGMREPKLADRLSKALATAPLGLDLAQWMAGQAGPMQGLDEALAEPGLLRVHDAHQDLLMSAAACEAARLRVLEVLAEHHARYPDELGPDAARLRRQALPRLPEGLWSALLARLRDQGLIKRQSAIVFLPEHSIRLSADEQRLAERAAAGLLAAGFEGAWVRDLARDLGEPELLMRVTLSRLAARGELFQVVKDLFYPMATMTQLARLCRQVAAEHGGVVLAAQYRDATGLGRKRAIQILEYFDRVGLLRRHGDQHKLRTDSEFLAESTL